MDNFSEEIVAINSIEALVSLKEQIKSQIVQSPLHWQTRMYLYQKVQFINSRIEQLSQAQ